MNRNRPSVRAACLGVALLALAPAAAVRAELAVEPIPAVVTLPEQWPDTWVYAHDMRFDALLDGRIVVVDVAADTQEYKGAFDAGMMGGFAANGGSGEMYTTQTFFSRRTYGTRTDVITVWDRSTLKVIDEIELPPRRLQVVTQKSAFVLGPDGRTGYVMNFTPAASVTVVDLPGRRVVSEVNTPGCNLVFVTGARGFSNLCSDGSLATQLLDEGGQVVASERTEPFIDVDRDAMFEKSAMADGITYFPTFLGRVQPIDFRGDTPAILDPFDLLDDETRAAGWRPGGWQVIDADALGNLYILMHPDGAEGTHKSGGTEVWVVNAANGKRSARLPLQHRGVSVAVTKGDVPLLVVTNERMEIDVYDTARGELQRTIGLGSAAYPFVIHALAGATGSPR